MTLAKIKERAGAGIFGAAAGAAALAIIGFSWGGWVTAGTAKQMSETAVVEELVPICVGQFDADPEKATKLAELKKTDYWKHAEYVAAQGWATMPGNSDALDSVARSCASRIAS